VRSRRLKLATGLEYHLLEWGAGPPDPDDTVLLLHGFLDQAASWEQVAARLPGRHLIAPDLRGHGDSDRVGAGGYYHFIDYLADVHDLVEQLAPHRLSLVGHSMGGAISAYYAGSFPARVHRLVVMEGLGPPEGLPTGPERVVDWLGDWARVRARPSKRYADVDAAARRLIEHDRLLAPAVARRLAEVGTRPAPGGVEFKHDPLHLTRGPYAFEVAVAERFWRRVACPVLLLEGAESTFRQAPAEAARREACFARVERRVIAGAGHMMQRHQPEAVARALEEFLNGKAV
jgi:pimeloyl-ACP methyl ester carboxylesterase